MKTLKQNEKKYVAPIEIEDSETLRFLGITWDDCRKWNIGGVKVLVYPMPTDNKEFSEGALRMLREKYTKQSRESRCLVPGKSGKLIACPESNHCSKCPYGFSAEDRKLRTESLDLMLDSGIDPGMTRPFENDVIAKIEYEDLQAIAEKKDPNLARQMRLQMAGLSAEDIASITGVKKITVWKRADRIKEIGRRYRRG